MCDTKIRYRCDWPRLLREEVASVSARGLKNKLIEVVLVHSGYRVSIDTALFIWSRVPETTLPLETTLRSVYMELRVVTAVPSSTLVSLETASQVTYSTKWRAP